MLMSSIHPLLDFTNSTKEKLQQDEVTLGLFLLSGSPIIAEACTTFPLDWILVDGEASPVSKENVLCLFQAMTGSSVTPLIRVAELNHHLIEHALDVGAHGILVPKVENVDMARRAVAACFFSPQGRRGINPVRASGYFSDVGRYLELANERTLCMVQIETKEGIKNVDDIARTEHINVIFIGPGDLASALGQPGNVEGPAMDEARHRILEATLAAGKVPGIFAYSLELAQQYMEEGFRFVAISNDIKLLRESLAANLTVLRHASGSSDRLP